MGHRFMAGRRGRRGGARGMVMQRHFIIDKACGEDRGGGYLERVHLGAAARVARFPGVTVSPVNQIAGQAATDGLKRYVR